MNILFDLDSTLVTIEGIDTLGSQKGLENEISLLTEEAMNGTIPFEDIFEERLKLIQPTHQDFEALGKIYLQNLTPHALTVVTKLKNQGHRLSIITGGYETSTLPVAA